MILAGLLKNSFIDYPGKISCVLFTTGCNFMCPYCHNADLARGNYPQRIPLGKAVDFLEARRGMLEGVVITGGEPTLVPGITGLCRTIKSMGYPVKLDTNGSRPERLSEILHNGLADYIAMDIKAPLTNYAPFCRNADIGHDLADSIQTIMTTAPDYEFRTTCVSPFVNAAAIPAIAKSIKGAVRYVLQAFNPRATCLDPAFDHRRQAIPADRMQQWTSLAKPFVQHCLIR